MMVYKISKYEVRLARVRYFDAWGNKDKDWEGAIEDNHQNDEMCHDFVEKKF